MCKLILRLETDLKGVQHSTSPGNLRLSLFFDGQCKIAQQNWTCKVMLRIELT
jgi:hypothetical protein